MINIWKYICKIEDINLFKLEMKLVVMYKSWYEVTVLRKYKQKSITDIKIEKENKNVNLGYWLSFSNLTGKISNINLSAMFKDSVGSEHELMINNIIFPSRFVVLLYKLVGKRINVFSNDILVDNKSIIDPITFQYVEPPYVDRIKKFVNEFNTIGMDNGYN